VGAALPLPYGWAVTCIDGRDWTVLSTAIPPVPTLPAGSLVIATAGGARPSYVAVRV
jgi:nitrate/nitrite transporter NarK